MSRLHRQTNKIIRTIERGAGINLTEHGKPKLVLKAIKPVDRKAAAAALRAIRPMEFPSRN